MRGLVLLTLLALSFAVPVKADRGGNGADQRPEDDGAAWFLGNRAIRYCFISSPDFGVSDKDIKNTLATAFNTWRSYIQAKKINDSEVTKSSYSDPLSSVGSFPIRGESEFYGRCDGKEDLRFYFGIKTPLTEKYKSQYFRPTAFAQRLSYDPIHGWGKGFIWLAPSHTLTKTSPDWQLPNRLNGIVLHEIGHVLGNRHVEGTIMDENIAKWIPEKDLSASAAEILFTRIDQSHELYMCERCGFDVSGSLSDAKDLAQAFETFVGRAPKGRVTARLRKLSSINSDASLSLLLQDDLGKCEFPVQFSYDVVSHTDGEIPVFKKTMASNSGSLKSRWLTASSVAYSAAIQTLQGQTMELVINRNETLSPVAVQYRKDGRHHYFFLARFLNE